ncbi:MAG: hypothetical protein AAF219_04660 [Myxococcota bacterium]
MRLLFFLAATVALAGCGVDVDEVQDVEDLRILAIRADPPEVLLAAEDAFEFENASIEVSFQALVVDPQGGSVDVEWRFCPIESTEACLDFAEVRDAAPDFAEALDAMRELRQNVSGVGRVEAQQVSVPEFEITPFELDLPSGLARYHLETSVFGLGLGAWPSVQLRVSSDRDSVLATRRFVLGVDDPYVLSPRLNESFGFEVCGSEPDDTCVALSARSPNRNPRLETVEVAFSELATADFVSVSSLAPARFGPIPIDAGQSIRVRPVFSADSIESYQLLRADNETQRVRVVEAKEELSVQWFITAGEVDDEVTSRSETLTLDTVYTAPDVLPDGGAITIWFVASDQRGGVVWGQLELSGSS